MSAGDLDNRMPTSAEAHAKLAGKFGPWLLFAEDPPENGIDFTWDIPFLCGISLDAKTGYVHRGMERIDRDQDDFKTAMGHERGEIYLIRMGWKYNRAHQFGNFAEVQLLKVLQPGTSYSTYNERIEAHADKIEKLPIRRCPKDLALYPYRDSPEILKAIKYAQRHPKR